MPSPAEAVFLRSLKPLLRAEQDADAGTPLPTEFLIFAAGENASTKGSVVFDADSAASVMQKYQEHGVDCMIDVEHASLDWMSPDPDSRNARGWFTPALRPSADGQGIELWATNVTWTPDGARRLRERTQRYTSPAFQCKYEEVEVVDAEGYKGKSLKISVSELINVAICAMPATHHNAALVASRQARTDGTQNVVAPVPRTTYAPGDDMAEPTKRADKADEKPKYKTAREAMAAAKALLAEGKHEAAAAALAEAPDEDGAPAAEEEKPAAEDPEKKSADPAPTAALSANDAEELVQLRAERDKRDADERRSLSLELVQIGAETPATVALNDRLSLPELRSKVEALRAAPRRSSAALPPAVTPPPIGAAKQSVEALDEVERWHYDQIKDDGAKARYLERRLAGKAKQETK